MRKPSQTLSESDATDWDVTKRLLSMTWSYRGDVIRILGFQATLLALSLFGIGLTGLAIDFIRWKAQPDAPVPRWPLGWMPPEAWPALGVLGLISAAILAFAVLHGVLDFLTQSGINNLIQAKIVVDTRTKVYDKLQRLSFRFFDANASSSLINRVTSDVQALRAFVDQVLMQTVIVGISLVAYVAFMLLIDVRLTLACIAVTPLLLVISKAFSRLLQPAYARSRILSDALVMRIVESLRGIRVIKAFGVEGQELARFRDANLTVKSQQRWIFERVALFNPSVGVVSYTSLVVLLAYGGYLAARGEIPIGAGLVAFAAVLQQFSNQIQNISAIANSMHQSLRGARRVYEILDAPVEIVSGESAFQPQSVRGELRFEQVWFEHGSDPVLQEIDFAVTAGEIVAVVGPTGSGKSALMSLVPRFYDPSGGRILLDGTDLRDYDLPFLRRSIGLVFQESFLFSSSIAANIAFGHPEASDEQIQRAAKVACAHEFISAFPNGYDTVLGETGIGLSGGQKQRLAIARAILLDPPILLLDDPTAAVDPGTEREIADAIEGAMLGRTTFIVAHRRTMLQRANRILELDRGRIIQFGRPNEISRQTGYLAGTLIGENATNE